MRHKHRDLEYCFPVGSILLVAADPAISDQFEAALTAAGHSVLTAMLTREVLPIIREGGIDAVVIDSYDPRVGIIELARAIEALPDAPPIVLLSGSPQAPEISARIGVSAFLPKPCDPAELVAVTNRLVRGSHRPVRIVEDDPSGPSRPLI